MAIDIRLLRDCIIAAACSVCSMGVVRVFYLLLSHLGVRVASGRLCRTTTSYRRSLQETKQLVTHPATHAQHMHTVVSLDQPIRIIT